MEPLSGVASILSVLEGTAFVSKVAVELYRNYRDVPEELSKLATRISQTRSRIDLQWQLCQSLSAGTPETLLLDEALKALQTDLKDAITCLDTVRDSTSAKRPHPSGKERIIWLMKDKRTVMNVLQHLRDIDNNLSALLLTLSL
ncbi:MAG: hypothetical protein L6R39_007619 [Caloplaca ligustica]|nr:MAG: hypothetical protein L6R39_007619 [Caloplaca ligustica]